VRQEQGFAPARGGRLYYEVRGDGPAVLLVHAGLWDSRIWDDQMDAFAERHTVLRYDIRGFGRSDPPTIAFSHRQDMVDLLDFLGIPTAAIVGCSIGGGFALDLALEFPGRVDALVLVAAGMSGDETPDDERTKAIYAEVEKATEAGELERAVDLQLQVWTPLRTDPDVDRRIRDIAMDNRLVDTLDWSLSQRLDPPAAVRLSEIGVPTLFLIGDNDAPVMDLIADKVVAGVTGARKVVMRGTDHLPNMRRPDEFNRLVLEFLAEAQAVPAP
jgi:pimeloyl-ACP methyl ester carboxylesterase